MAKAKRPIEERLEPLAPGIGERIRIAARIIGDYAEAAEAGGIVYDQLRKIMNEDSVPSFPLVAALARRSGVTLTWLAFAEPPQFRGETLSTRKAFIGNAASAAVQFEEPDIFLVPHHGLRAAAGPGAEVDTEHVVGAVPFSRRYLEDVVRANPEDLAVLENDGDSMMPTIADRDLLLVHRRQRTIRNGQIFVLRLGNELVVKRVQRDVDGSVVLTSDNKAYADRRLTQAEADQVDVIGRLVWSGGPT